MPENKKYLIEIPGQEGVAYWGEERYNANKDALLKDHPDAIIAEVGSYSAEDAKDTDEYIINIPGKSGSAHWNAERFNANRDNLLKDFPNAQIQRVRPIDYWEDQRTDLNKRIEEHNAQYGSFLSEYENKREMERARGLMGDSMRNTPESDYLLENAREYSLRNKEKEALLKALHDNPREQQRKQNLYDSIMEMSSAVEREGNESYKASLAQYVAEGGNIAAPGADAVISNMSENRPYNGARRFLESAKETMEAPSKFDETNGFLNFMKGAGHTFGSPDFWTFGLTSIVDNLGARDAFEKIWSKFKTVDINKLSEDEIEQMLTPGERALVEAFTKKAMADSERANDLSLGYQSGMTSAESLGFMAQFILTGGVTSSVAKGATKWAAKGLARGFGNLARQGISQGMLNAMRGAGKFALGTTRSLIDAAVRTGITTTAPKSISEQLLPNIQQGTLPEANTAILKGLGDAFIENWSESYGEILGSVFKAPMNALFPEWSKAIARTPFMQVAQRAGFNGYLTEIGEEWFGNAMRTITQVDPNALKDFATVDNQIVTMTAFLPMTLIGGGVSMGQRRAAEKDLENKTMNLRHTLEKAGLNIDEIDALVDYRQSLSPQMLSDRFAPLITRIAHMPGNEALASEIFKSAGLFSQSVARYQAMEGGYQAEEDNAKNELRDEIVNKMGGNRFWNTRQSNATNENGEAYEFDEVQVITRADGSRFFIMGQMGDQLSTIDEDGRMGFTTEEELNKQFEDGIITSNRTMMLDQFLSEDVVARRREVEAQRMSEQAQSQIADLRANNPIGTVVNLGTRVNPISGVVVRYEQDRAILQTENHENPFISLSYEQLAQALNTPIRVLNDEQMAAEEAALIEADRAERETEQADTPDDMSVAEESTHSAAEFEEEAAPVVIPTNEDGSVDEAKFLEENPEEYVAWNDNNMQDGGADSREQLQMLIPVYQNMYNEAAKNWAANAANPVARRAAKASMAEWQEKIDRINNILAQYNMPSQENQPLADRTIQAELDDLHDGSLNDEEIASNIDAHIAEAQAAYDEYAKTAPIMGTDRQAYKTAKAEFEEGLKGLQQELDYWNEVKKANERYGEMMQQAEYEAMEARRLEAIKARVAEIANRLGAGVNVIERPEDVTDAAAKREIEEGRPPLGWYNVTTGNVDLYLPGIPSAQIAEETIMHEVVGHKGLRGLLGNEAFNDLCDSVWNYMANNLGKREQDFWLMYPGVNGDTRKAADEYMAHMAETVDFNEDRSTWEKIVNFIKDALRKIGLEVGVNDEYIVDMLKRSYAKMREESEVAPATAEEFLEESGFEVDEERDDIRLSSRYTTTEGQEAEIADAIVNVTGRSKEDAERWLQSEKSAASIVLADKQYLDYIPDDRYKAIKDNSDYPQGTVDFNNICRKRVSFTKMFTRLQRRYPNRVFTANDLADIRTIMSNDGLTVACGLCYVEDRRQMIGEVAAFFIDQMQKGFKDYTYEVSAKDFAEGKTKRKKLSKDKVKKAAKYAKLIGNDTYVPQIYDLTTAEGLDKLHNEHKGIWDAFQAFNSDRGQQAQNLFQGYAEYKREILGWSKAKVKKVNSLGGLRVFSYSDFEAHHLLDLIQIIIDCSAKGVMIQGYTKVPEFARAVANTGIKLNRSLIPLGDTGIVDGKLAYDPVEGIDTSDANFLESNDNVGNILIGINDEQIRLAMNDPFVHYIIPYHARQAKEILTKMKVGNWTNYLDFQNERNISDGKRVKKGINIYTDVLNETITNDREFVERYLEVCREKGYIPKFDQFLNKDAEGNYVYTPGYYKFLVDFKLFDESGNILPQKPVVAEFDDVFNAEILQKYVADEKQSTGDQMNATYEKIVKALGLNEKEAEGEDIRFKAAPRTDEERARLFETVKQQYGVTDNFKVAGYMLPDGSLLDFGDENEPNVRSLDHRNIGGVIMEEGREYDSRWQYVTDFLNEGTIRLMPESDAINLSVAPSAEQRAKLLDYFYKKNGYIILEIDDQNGRSAAYMEYDKGTSPYRIMRDIDGYFNEGIVPQQSNLMFSTSNHNQAIFVSNAAKAVEGIQMEKATPEQWLKMIEKNGGLKAGEDKWMGLSDWLKASDKKTLTKQEVLDFINENMIIIEEQHYSNEEMGKESVKILNERYQGWEDAFSFEWDGYMEEPSADISDYAAAVELYNKHHDDKMTLDEDGEFEDMNAYEKVRQFGVELSEIYHGSKSEVRPIKGIREQYTTRGLEYLREIALTVPTIESWGATDDTHFGDAGDGRAVAWIRFGDTFAYAETKEGKEYKAFVENMLRRYHIDEEVKLNQFGTIVIPEELLDALTDEQMSELQSLKAASMSASDKTEQRILVIDEIQSKRHQEGREKGYARGPKVSLTELKQKAQDFEQEMIDKYHPKDLGIVPFASAMRGVWTEEESNTYSEMMSAIGGAAIKNIGVPDAPFDKNWHELAMKRMLRYAAENGYDVVAWTKGEQQAERYNLSNFYDSIERNDHDSLEERRFELYGRGKSDNIVVDEIGEVVSSSISGINGKLLSDVVGKGIAVKMMSLKDGEDIETDEMIEIGGEGMKGFYDKMLPSFMNKYGKKWGIKVEDINLPNLENGLTMHSVPVTEEMKESVMEGQLMFSTKTYPASEEYATMFSTVTDPFKVAELESGKKIPAYRSVQIDNEGRIYSPMASRIQSRGRRNEAAQMREWDQAVENLDLVTRGEEYGKITILDEDGGQTKVSYNPYGHCCVNSMMNDQFKRAWERDGLYVMKVEAPESELTSGYKAEQAKDVVGIHMWKTGAVGRKLPESKRRQILLTRWMKNVQVMTWEEVAQDWINTLKGEKIDVPFNVVPRKILNLLTDAGVKIVAPEKGMENALNAYNEWKSNPIGYVGDTALPAHVAALNETKKPSGPDGGIRFSTRQPNQTAEEFHQAVVNDFKSKYNDIADIQVFPINEETAKRFDFTVDELNEIGGTYISEEDLIAIFAREHETDSNVIEEIIFHESVHKLYDFFDHLSTAGKWMWSVADQYKGFSEYKEHITENYTEGEYHEEMLSYMLGTAMACGGASKLYNGLPEDIQKYVDEIFNEIGYDRERESNERLLRLDDESSVEEAEGSKREENGGRGKSETEEILFSTNQEPVEEVVDKGLVLSVEDFTNLAIDIYKAIPESARKALVDNASRNDWKMRDAILQMPASLAMKKSLTDEEVEVAKIIAQKVEDAVIANGTGLARHLTTNEALWMLYRASNPISESNPFAMAERAVVADHLGFSPKAKEIDKAGEDEIRFRKHIYSPVASAAEAYTEAVSYWGNRMNEAFVDQYDAVDQMMKVIEDATGKKAETWEDIRLALTQSASKGFAKLQEVEKGLIQKMWDAVNAFAKEGVDEEKLARYVLLKHGLERNKIFAQRDARRSYEEEYRAEVKRIKNDSTLTDAEKKLRIDDAKNILDAHILDIDNETDVRYLENRKTDYSGVLAMFADYPGLMPADNYSSMEEYRSARRKSRKPRFKKLSKAEAEAQMECNAFEAGRDALVNDLWDSINNLTKGTLKMQYEYGMLSADAYKSLSKMFKYYVPMRGFSDNTGEDLYDYYSHNVSDGYAPALIGAKGRKSEAESPFGWMAAMAATAIVSGEKNAAKQALYYFAMNRRVNDLLKVADAWYVQSPTDPNTYYPEFPPLADPNKTIAENAQQYADWEKQMEDLRSQGKAVKKTNRLDVAEVANFGVKDAPEHIIKVNIAGEEKQLILNANPRAAQAINGLLNIESDPDYQKVLGRVLRWMSQVSTGWNPEFWMTNILRDSITAFAAIGIKEDKVYNEAWRKNWVEAWKIVKLLPKLKDGTLGTGRLEDLLREAVENGVQTGYSHIKSMEEWDKDMNKYLKELNKDEAKAVTAVKKFVDGVQTLSESMELVSRFATYITSRELGRDITRSVSDAKEVTVNFNRKGSGMRITFEEAKKLKWADGTPIFSEKWKGAKRLKGMLSVAYVSGLSALAPFGRKYMMFFNAGVQGVNMWLQMYRKGYGKKVNALAGAAFALGILNSVIQGIIDGDDNDYQENIGAYERRSNLMLGAKGFYLKFALPQELRAFYGLGDILYNYGAGNYHHKDTPVEILKTVTNQLMDIMPINPMGGWEEFIPSMAKATVEAGVAIPFLGEPIKGTNKNFAGAPLRDEKPWLSDAERESMPKYAFAGYNTWNWLVDLAELANRATGGTKYEAGWLQLDPVRIQHYAEQATGGIGGFVGKLASTVNAAFDSETEMKVSTIPFLNKVFTIADEKGQNKLTTEQFYYYKGVAEASEMRYSNYVKEGDKASKKKERNSDEFKIMKIYNKYDAGEEMYKSKLKRARNSAEEKDIKAKRDARRKEFINELAEKGLL